MFLVEHYKSYNRCRFPHKPPRKNKEEVGEGLGGEGTTLLTITSKSPLSSWGAQVNLRVVKR